MKACNPITIREAHRAYWEDETMTLAKVAQRFGGTSSGWAKHFKRLGLPTKSVGAPLAALENSKKGHM